jgi:hypothetical protein
MKKSINARNVEAIKRLANIDANREWANKPSEVQIMNHAREMERIGVEYMKYRSCKLF